ncbi:hypothetical protein CHU92_15080 [Flavobacterium cyanobacteriorum]|uniref:Uncharacterized protein n=2 Tax=Flavobacterium cyanobacteriorum TaxID=2022802 RepID=A0A255YTH0_9FLAO|nr:hypothetical protein CHU92_15080 [Flavobacterium cyanobacteriorum]
MLLAQDLSKDTIFLKELIIEKDNNKKKKKIKLGKGQHKHMWFEMTASRVKFPVYFVVENLPQGKLSDLTLYFSSFRQNTPTGKSVRKDYLNHKTVFKIMVYDMPEDGNVGAPLNSVPIIAVINEDPKGKDKKFMMDVEEFDFKSNAFMLSIETVSDTSCHKCYYYVPLLYVGETSTMFLNKEDKLVGIQNYTSLKNINLRVDVSYYK